MVHFYISIFKKCRLKGLLGKKPPCRQITGPCMFLKMRWGILLVCNGFEWEQVEGFHARMWNIKFELAECMSFSVAAVNFQSMDEKQFTSVQPECVLNRTTAAVIPHIFTKTLLLQRSRNPSTVVSPCGKQVDLAAGQSLTGEQSILLTDDSLTLNFLHHCHIHNHSSECPPRSAAIRRLCGGCCTIHKIFSPQHLNLMIFYLSSFDMYYSFFILLKWQRGLHSFLWGNKMSKSIRLKGIKYYESLRRRTGREKEAIDGIMCSWVRMESETEKKTDMAGNTRRVGSQEADTRRKRNSSTAAH